MAKITMNPKIADFCDIDIRRCSYTGGKWTDDPKGDRVRIAKLKVKLASGYTTSNVSNVYVKLSTDSSNKIIDKTTACSTSGYIESTPRLFTSLFDANKNYTFNVAVYSNSPGSIENFYQNYTLNRASCLMDFSPAGGVAIGTFIAEGNGIRQDPRFEVGPNHKAYFLGGIEGVTNLVANKIVETGGKINASSTGKYNRYLFRIENDIENGATGQYTPNGLNTGLTDPVALYGAVSLNDGMIIPLPYFRSTSQYASVYFGAGGALNVVNHTSQRINNGYVMYDYIDMSIPT